ncbi:hypothetical protein AWM75_02885 [Aerococcus urinaehominis]|uniref:Probable peptidoglycan glycosyltransferase FtsW n=1 Tax=Aerococcus urinaehominis TaxID=128944 RepID=A0A0X8FKJ7_9LACT|nr:FtsW/RodA/SpoVE family cell cycle protein [Aerococcus urinaehominis]AMB99005.1 hypothetical protein AWM75_02885 [Aerococcus urinaehominis]SDM57352.1 cell division protein FtsW [Aerococcus urinaehominis]
MAKIPKLIRGKKARGQSKHQGQKQTKKKGWIPKANWADLVNYLDLPVFVVYIVLSLLGVFFVYSASSYTAAANDLSPAHYAVRQASFLVFAFAAGFFIYRFNIEKVFRNKNVLKGLALILTLAMLYVSFFGQVISGAQGWIQIAGISIQPVEFLKPATILLLAHIFADEEDLIYQQGLSQILTNQAKHKTRNRLILALILFWLGLTFALPDMGGVAILASLTLVMFLASGIDVKFAKYTGIAIGGAYIIGTLFLKLFDISGWVDSAGSLGYQINRLTAYAHPFKDELNTGLQLINSLYALSNGGLFGLGIGQSIQKTGYLPEPYTDFIMAIVGEEYGFIVLMLILGAYLYMVFHLFYRAIKMEKSYHQLVLIGIATYFLVQFVINIGGAIGLLPITGITFPFISYGGSSILTSTIMVALALSTIRDARRTQQIRERRKIHYIYPQNEKSSQV